MADRLILALDQGTTSSRAILFGRDGRPVAQAQREFPQHFPAPGHVEHDPEDIWESQLAVGREAMAAAGVRASDVAAVGVTNQGRRRSSGIASRAGPWRLPSCGRAG